MKSRTRDAKPLSLHPLELREAVRDLIRVKPEPRPLKKQWRQRTQRATAPQGEVTPVESKTPADNASAGEVESGA